MEELVEYLKGVNCPEIENPLEKNSRNNNNSSGLEKTRMKSHKTPQTTAQASRKAANTASSAGCL
eukprot:9855999-Ditylum_brightwellii.AAC.1